MRVKVRGLWKKIITALSNKTNELRIRIMIFFLLHKNIDKTTLTQSLHALVSQPPSSSHHPRHRQHRHDENELEDVVVEEDNNASFLVHQNEEASISSYDDEGLSLTHELFKESKAEMEAEAEAEAETEAIMVQGGGAVEGAVEVEDEDIDQAADLFIERFKRKIQLQKQLSLERHQSLLVSNA